MKIKRISVVLLIMFLTVALFSGCGNKEEKVVNEAPKELKIYCGVTMLRPINELAKLFEEKENCKIIVEKGGSGDLLNKIKTNKTGDLYLPGSDSYIKTCLEEKIVTESALVGYNKAAILVQKGNPKNITNNLENLKNETFSVVIGNPKSGSIGKETKKILDKKGIYEDVVANAKQLTNDSRELLRVIKDKEADIVINWYAVSVWDNNQESMDVLNIDEQFAAKKKLVLGLLSFSENKELAQKFMALASSEQGKQIFDSYGLYDIK